MTPEQLELACRRALEQQGPCGVVALKVPGKQGSAKRRKLAKGIPLGHIVLETRDGVVALFSAHDLLAAIDKAWGLKGSELSGQVAPNGE